MEIPHEDQSSHYDHEKDKFAYLSMRDQIELGKRQVQQSQWGSKYALNGDDSYEHTVGECPTIPTVRDMYGYQSSYTSSWNNHPNLTTQPQPQPSMSTSSLEQAILKISKVMEDFVEKVQDSIEKLTNLDIARGKKKLPPQPHHNLQETNAKRSRKVLKIDTLVGDCYDNSMDQPSIENRKVQDDKGLPEPFKASTSPGKRRETNSLGPNGKDANFVWDPGGIQHEVGMQNFRTTLAQHPLVRIFELLHPYPPQSQASEPHFFAPLCLRPEEAMPQLPKLQLRAPVEETMPSYENTRTETKVLFQPTQKATTDASTPQDLTII
ncbi:hypothetical protein CK203_062286 [Vitis vinifera]|uniref:Uncharacterized protein n=1 Tax=Vitis vinifera TaxID=29760 RepID=A0A438GD11_VITVI|nr:hypothetical protein CK203_062286 [Vitis vinifera]